MKKHAVLIILKLIFALAVQAQQGYTSISNLTPLTVTSNIGEKPQAKVWQYAGKHWALLHNLSSTFLWRLDGNTWNNILRLSTRTSSKADCEVVGKVAHILLFQGASSPLVSVEYSQNSASYHLWSKRKSTVGLNLKPGVETATIDIDGNGRMWLAYDGTTDISVSWSEAPYNKWSSPIILATGVTNDDISSVITLPSKIGLLWSNQSTQRFGFKTYSDGADPNSWSIDEVPAAQSALNIGMGMADDHVNMAVGFDGTLYCAVRTGYNDNKINPEIAL